MVFYGKVVGGHYVNATININRKGELALNLGLKKTPNLTAEAVGSWEEITTGSPGGAAGAVSKMGQAVARASIPGLGGKAAAAAVGSAVDSAMSTRTIRVDWVDGSQSLIQLPDKYLQHLAILLKDRQIPTAAPEVTTPSGIAQQPGMLTQMATLAGLVPPAAPDATEQIAKLAALRDQGAITEEEFSAKKAELLGRI